ncbi:hypothetical protein LCH18_08410 [Acinetobacter johnsonii]|uniref:hypothetical protein n=1 Tax=Acinetobacter johnsonii TaxID=40214 RepID=UPI001CCFE15C|nr:hypothetical protein [Acinetobacter johnsonii]UBQ39374.1 hypothetical protein LCH18_08410 [Acinetobacter johnsonii]
MKKIDLKDKIENLLSWTLIFLILYLLFGFLFISSWLENIPKLPKIYDLVKDGLTITAALLAPFSAFVLFSDWREEHVEKLLDVTARQVSEDLKDIYMYSYLAYYKEPTFIDVEGYDLKFEEHPSKGSLLSMRKSLENKHDIIMKSYGDSHILCHKLLELIDLSLNIENIIRKIKYMEFKVKMYKDECEEKNRMAISQLTKGTVKDKKLFELHINKMMVLNREIDVYLDDLLI